MINEPRERIVSSVSACATPIAGIAANASDIDRAMTGARMASSLCCMGSVRALLAPRISNTRSPPGTNRRSASSHSFDPARVDLNQYRFGGILDEHYDYQSDQLSPDPGPRGQS